MPNSVTGFARGNPYSQGSVTTGRHTLLSHNSALVLNSRCTALLGDYSVSDSSYQSFASCSQRFFKLKSGRSVLNDSESSIPESSSVPLPRRLQRHARLTRGTRWKPPSEGFDERFKPFKVRSLFPKSVTWNAKYRTFDTYCSIVTGFLLQVGCSYLLDKTVIKKYKEEGESYFKSNEFWASYGISFPQVKYDIEYFYGILLCSCRNKPNRVFLKYKALKLRNGLMCWDKMVNEFSYGGSKDLMVDVLEASLMKRPTSNSKEALLDYVDEYELSTYKLDVLLEDECPTDKEKKLAFLRRFSHVDSTCLQYCILQSRQDPTRSFQDMLVWIRKTLLYQDLGETAAELP